MGGSDALVAMIPSFVLSFLAEVYERAFAFFMSVVEMDLVPDFVLRRGMRFLLAKRLRDCGGTTEEEVEAKNAFVAELKSMPVAINTADANEQHYEVPTEYYLLCLGRNLKPGAVSGTLGLAEFRALAPPWARGGERSTQYSSCLYEDSRATLEDAEEAMLSLYCQRAQLKDGQDILELGCGWGSLSMYMARNFPGSRITSVSNSKTQKEFIDSRCREQGITNLKIITADMAVFGSAKNSAGAPAGSFDRMVSIEMFEHMKNYQELLGRCARWLRPGGMLFVHIFAHMKYAYHFEIESEDDWMAKYFFTGGTMPSHDLFLHFQDDLLLDRHWRVNGTHYGHTCNEWLRRTDNNRAAIKAIFADTYGKSNATKWWVRWRLFYMACAELFDYRNGEEWGVSHYLFRKP